MSFTGVNFSFSWLSAAASVSLGEYGGDRRTGLYLATGSGAGAGTVPGKSKKSWLPSISLTIEAGASESLDAFEGPSEQVTATTSAAFWTAGGSLLANSYGSGWIATGGVGTPGLKVAANGQWVRTRLLTQRNIVAAKPPTRAQPDVTAVRRKQDR